MCVSCSYVYVDSAAAPKITGAAPALGQRLVFVWARVIRNTPPPGIGLICVAAPGTPPLPGPPF